MAGCPLIAGFALLPVVADEPDSSNDCFLEHRPAAQGRFRAFSQQEGLFRCLEKLVNLP
jgi:hypothetical protein